MVFFDVTKHPLRKNEAVSLCEKFKNLEGKPLNQGGLPLLIRHVALCPYDENDRYLFLQEYSKCGNIAEALRPYEGDTFDVLLIAEIVAEKKYIRYKTLTEYLEEQ